MSNSLLRPLLLWLTPVLAFTLAGGYFFANESMLPQIVAYALVLSLSLSLAYLTLHRLVKAPIDAIGKVVTTLRATRGTLPPELPVQRADEIGRLAREVALLAGDRNASDICREDGENKISALISAVADNVFRLDQDGLILSHHSSVRARPFTDAESILGRKIADILPESVTDACVKALASVFVGGAAESLEFSINHGDARCSYEARFTPSGQGEVLLTIRDMTEQKETDSSKSRLDAILDATLDPVVTVTIEGEIRYLNPVGFHLLGVEAPLQAGLKFTDFLPEWAREQIQDTAIPTAIEEGKWHGESALLTPGDNEIPVSITAVSHPTDSGGDAIVSLIARDQSERKRFDDHLLFLADHDPLTSLYTRRRFVEELGREIARAQRSGSGGAVLVLDLDDLKYVNDSVGHATGDRLLSELALLIKKHMRATDILARLDGDEFALLITETQPSRVEFVVERLLKSVRNHSVDTGGQLVGVTASAGIAFFPEHGATADELLSRADQALARAKQRGRDQFVLFTPDEKWQAQVNSRLTGDKLIREALAHGRFVLFAQPILDLKTDTICQYEILLRMLDENDELMAPASFLDTAERFGLIRSIDRWVVRQAIQLMGRQHKTGNDVRLSVNLSGKSLGDFDLTTLIEQELRENSVDPSLLTFEITETTAISDTDRAKIFANALRHIGCHLALDDFGVGFSSFHKLKHLPVDYLKIDGSFIRDLPKNKVDQHLVRAMVEVARALRKRTVAEFVGSAETLELVKKAGVDYGQGFYIGKPDAVEKFLSQEPLARSTD